MSVLRRSMDGVRSLDPRVLDAGLAVGLTAWALALPGTLSDPGRAFVLVAMTVAVAWWRRAPVTVLAIEVAGVAVILRQLNWPEGIAFLIAGFSAAFYSDRRVVVAALLLATAAWLFAFGGQVNIPSGLVPLVLVAPAWLAGSACAAASSEPKRRPSEPIASSESARRRSRPNGRESRTSYTIW